MAGASERSLPHCHGGSGAKRLGSRGSSGYFLSATAPLAPQGPRPDTGAGPGNRKRKPIQGHRGQERVRDGPGSLRQGTDSREGREREGGRKVGEGENRGTGGHDPHRPHCYRQEVTIPVTLSVSRK